MQRHAGPGRCGNEEPDNILRLSVMRTRAAVTHLTWRSDNEANAVGRSRWPRAATNQRGGGGDGSAKPRKGTICPDPCLRVARRSVLLGLGRDGGTGRRSGLKIRKPERVVGVRVPLSAPTTARTFVLIDVAPHQKCRGNTSFSGLAAVQALTIDSLSTRPIFMRKRGCSLGQTAVPLKRLIENWLGSPGHWCIDLRAG